MREHAEHHPAGWRMPAATIRDQRLKLASDMLALTLRDVATMPTPQQEAVREAVKHLQRVQAWCQSHAV